MNDLKITVNIVLPYYSWTFLSTYTENTIEIPFRKIDYQLTISKTSETVRSMSVKIEWTQRVEIFDINNEFKNKLVEKGIDFLNHMIYHLRTFDIETSNIILVSPRITDSVHLVIHDNEDEILNEKFPLINEPPDNFKLFFEYLNDFESESVEIFFESIREEQIQLLEINLLVDAYHAIYESRYSEAIINCLTAVETHIFPLLTNWLTSNFSTKNEKNAENVLIGMSASTKFELLFGCVKSEFLSSQTKLLEDLKAINKLRNDIIHKGKRANKSEANNCLDVSSKLIMILFFKMSSEEI